MASYVKDAPTSGSGPCARCQNLATNSCGGCLGAPADDGQSPRRTFYCNVECQKADWKRHKIECKSLQARKQLSNTTKAMAHPDIASEATVIGGMGAEDERRFEEKGAGHTSREEDTGAPAGGLYAIKPIPGKGHGVIATSRIPKGTRILSEAPIFKVPRGGPGIPAVERIIARELKSLSKDQHEAFFALHNIYGKTQSPALGIARTNVLPLGSGALEGGVFLQASRINHSCRHNAQNTWNANLERITIHALRDIEEGQEIAISYLGGSPDYAERQRYLKKTFSFDCRCELCSLPPAQRKKSDYRLNKISSIDDDIGEAIEEADDIVTGLRLVRKLLGLFKEEGIWDARIPRAYYDAFQVATANGDKTRARVFAQRAYAARVVVEGEDSPKTIEMKRLAECSLDKEPPGEMGEEELENWLWMEKK